MIILYDLIAAQPEGSSPVSGGGEYAVRIFLAILRYLEIESAHEVVLHAVYDIRKPIDKGLLSIAQDKCTTVHSIDDIDGLPELINSIKARRFFSALPMRFRKLHLPEDCEFVYTIHGLRPLELPWDVMEPHYFHSLRSIARHLIPRLLGRYYLNSRKEDFKRLFSVSKQQQIITVSRHTRYALLSMFPQTQKVPVHTYFSPPFEEELQASAKTQEYNDTVLNKLGVTSRSYYLLISANRWGKNSYRFLQAYQRLIEFGLVKRKIVILGKGKAKFLEKVKLNPQCIVCEYVSRIELETLYRNAYAFVFPTLNEGFGYPPLECMKYGTPVLASAINSLPELLENAYLPLDPKSDIELSSRLLQIENETELWETLSKNSIQQYEKIYRQQVEHRNQLIQLLTNE